MTTLTLGELTVRVKHVGVKFLQFDTYRGAQLVSIIRMPSLEATECEERVFAPHPKLQLYIAVHNYYRDLYEAPKRA